MYDKELKKILFVLWVGFIIFFFYLYYRSGITLTTCPDAICNAVALGGFIGPLIFITLMVLRTLTLFSVTIFVVAAGALFDPWNAILYTFIGINLSALLAFVVGQYFGQEVFMRAGEKLTYFPKGDAFRRNGFMSVMMMYLLFVPFDWVGYLAGAYSVRLRDMMLGAAIGTLPGLVAFVFLGGAFRDPVKALPLFFAFFLLGLSIAHVLKKTSFGRGLYIAKEDL